MKNSETPTTLGVRYSMLRILSAAFAVMGFFGFGAALLRAFFNVFSLVIGIFSFLIIRSWGVRNEEFGAE